VVREPPLKGGQHSAWPPAQILVRCGSLNARSASWVLHRTDGALSLFYADSRETITA
jgi:hypothetical protein